MTSPSKKRKQARYLRRKNKREKKYLEATNEYRNYDKVFSYGKLYKSYRLCRRGVSWKASVIKYICQAPLLVYETWLKLHNCKYRSKGFAEFDIFERGKKRHIKACLFEERIVQRCLCDNCLVPIFSRILIYDNGASTKCKGYSFAVKRFRRHIRKCKPTFVFSYDYSGFFDSIQHEIIIKYIVRYVRDERLCKLAMHFVSMFGDVGLGLGSQISQTFALVAANSVDHVIKNRYGVIGYARYMDDGYIMGCSVGELLKYRETVQQESRKLGLVLNNKKTVISRTSKVVKYLKCRFTYDGNKIIQRMDYKSVIRERRKLRKLKKRVEAGIMTKEKMKNSLISWRGHASKFNAGRWINGMNEYWNDLMERKRK